MAIPRTLIWFWLGWKIFFYPSRSCGTIFFSSAAEPNILLRCYLPTTLLSAELGTIAWGKNRPGIPAPSGTACKICAWMDEPLPHYTLSCPDGGFMCRNVFHERFFYHSLLRTRKRCWMSRSARMGLVGWFFCNADAVFAPNPPPSSTTDDVRRGHSLLREPLCYIICPLLVVVVVIVDGSRVWLIRFLLKKNVCPTLSSLAKFAPSSYVYVKVSKILIPYFQLAAQAVLSVHLAKSANVNDARHRHTAYFIWLIGR